MGILCYTRIHGYVNFIHKECISMSRLKKQLHSTTKLSFTYYQKDHLYEQTTKTSKFSPRIDIVSPITEDQLE